jgi:hypothetical protein
MKALWCLLIAVTVCTACTPVNKAPQSLDTAPRSTASEPPQQGEAVAVPTVNFFDVSSFDNKLSSTLRSDPQTTQVHLQAPATVNAIPERLGKWLSMVEKYDGTVHLQEDPDYQSRSFPGVFSIAVGAFLMAYKAIENSLLYGPVKDYNATVFYMRGSGTITKVVFTRKTSTPQTRALWHTAPRYFVMLGMMIGPDKNAMSFCKAGGTSTR